MDWIHEAEGRDKWLHVLNVVIMFGMHKLQQVLWLAEDMLASQEGLFPVESVICRELA